jgi:MarR family transcriptional regulator, organic hydroperoxide resistance regulator
MSKTKLIDPVGQVLTLAARRQRARTASMLAELNLFPGQDQVLQSLYLNDGLTMGAVADQLSIKPPTASKMIARMAAQGLLERKGKVDDARLVAVFITDEGRARIDPLRKIAKRVEKEALVGLDDKDVRRLRRLLKKVSKNLGADTQEADGDEADPDE